MAGGKRGAWSPTTPGRPLPSKNQCCRPWPPLHGPTKGHGERTLSHVSGSKARLSVTHAPPTQHLPECPSATKTSYHQLSGSEPHKFTVLEFHSQTPREAPRGEAKLSQATSP